MLYHTRTVTLRAGGERSAVFGTCSVAVFVLAERFKLYGFRHAFGEILKREFQCDAEVVAATLPGTGTAAAAGCRASEASHVVATAAENVAEHAEDIVHRHACARESACTSAGESLRSHRMSVGVILLTLFGVAQHIVGFGSLFEFFFSGFVTRILVGMIFYGKFAISLFQLIGSGVFADAKHFVVVSFIHYFGKLSALWD